MRIHINPFVRRQTLASPFSYFLGTFEELEHMLQVDRCEACNGSGRRTIHSVSTSYALGRNPTSETCDTCEGRGSLKPDLREGYRPGVKLLAIRPELCQRFLSGVVRLEEGQAMIGAFEARREGEAPRKVLQAARWTVHKGTKLPAQSVELVLYSSALLAESGDNSAEPGADSWEVISINASPTIEATPIQPETLMHNHFGSDGGTATGMSDSEFVAALRESFVFWADKAMIGGE